jgi:hypothetical protein
MLNLQNAKEEEREALLTYKRIYDAKKKQISDRGRAGCQAASVNIEDIEPKSLAYFSE